MEQDGNETHVGKLAVVLHHCAAHGLHLVAAEKAELGLGVALGNGPHEIRRMKVATRLTNNQIVLHRFQLFILSIAS